MTKETSTLTTVGPQNDKQIVDEFLALVNRTHKEKPSKADLAELEQMLSAHNDLKLWRHIGGMAHLSESTLLARSTFVTPALAACWKERQAEMRRELGGDDVTEAEKYLISHVSLCWLRLMMTEHMHTSHLCGEHSLKVGAYWDKRLTEAQKRYTRAVETLAKVRTLTAATKLIESRTAAASTARSLNSALAESSVGHNAFLRFKTTAGESTLRRTAGSKLI